MTATNQPEDPPCTSSSPSTCPAKRSSTAISARETARILHNSAERLATLHTNYGALSYENPEQLYLLDNAGAVVGYVSTVEIDDISPVAQDRIAEHIAAAAR